MTTTTETPAAGVSAAGRIEQAVREELAAGPRTVTQLISAGCSVYPGGSRGLLRVLRRMQDDAAITLVPGAPVITWELTGPSRRVDPPGCTCEDCGRGRAVPLDQAAAGEIRALLRDGIANDTGLDLDADLTVTVIVSAAGNRIAAWAADRRMA